VRGLRATVCLGVLAALLRAGSALGDDPTARAKALFAEATRQLDDGDYVGALSKYRAAYALLPSPKILLNIGTILRQLGRNAEAATVYAQYLADPGADPTRRQEVEQLLRRLDTAVAIVTIEMHIESGHVRLDGAELKGNAWPRSVRVEPGSHTVVVERGADAPIVKTLMLAAGETATVDLDAPPAEPSTSASAAPAPSPPPQVPSSGRVPGSGGIGVPTLVLGALGVVGLAGGVYFALAARSDRNSLDERGCKPSCPQEDVDRAKQHVTLANVLVGVGGASLGAAVVIYFVSDRPSSSAAAQTATGVGFEPTPGGMLGRLRFRF
jgi:hypothetical protein